MTEADRRQMVANVIFIAGHDEPCLLEGNIDLCRKFGISASDLRAIAENLKCAAGIDLRKAAERMAKALEGVA
jgi:hypothetical protein